MGNGFIEIIYHNVLSHTILCLFTYSFHVSQWLLSMIAQHGQYGCKEVAQEDCSEGLLLLRRIARVVCSVFTIRLRGAQIPLARVSMGLIWWASKMVCRTMSAWLGSHVPHAAGAHIHASSAELVWDAMACGAYGASAARGRARGVAG
jgi:hypothetical protein